MCDYSLMMVPNRLAIEGEELVAHRGNRVWLTLMPTPRQVGTRIGDLPPSSFL